jgi:hypothetical protein
MRSQWAVASKGTAIKFADEPPQMCGSHTATSMTDFDAALTKAHDDFFYKATGLSDYKDEDKLFKYMLEQLYGEEMAIKTLLQSPGGAGEEQLTTRPVVKDLLMHLLYFGIGGAKNSCAKYIRRRLNGSTTPTAHGPSLNHFVTKDEGQGFSNLHFQTRIQSQFRCNRASGH